MVLEVKRRTVKENAEVQLMRKASKRNRRKSKKIRRSKAYKPLDNIRKQAINQAGSMVSLSSTSLNSGIGSNVNKRGRNINGVDMGMVFMQDIEECSEDTSDEEELTSMDK